MDMAKSPEENGFLHDHGKELAVGSIAALGMLGLVFVVARQHLKDIEPEGFDEPSDNS